MSLAEGLSTSRAILETIRTSGHIGLLGMGRYLKLQRFTRLDVLDAVLEAWVTRCHEHRIQHDWDVAKTLQQKREKLLRTAAPSAENYVPS